MIIKYNLHITNTYLTNLFFDSIKKSEYNNKKSIFVVSIYL